MLVNQLVIQPGGSALTLLVTQVLADHHDPAVTADHLALVADLLDAGMNLHLPAVLIGLPPVTAIAGRTRESRLDREWTMPLRSSAVERSAVTEDDATTGQVIRTELHHYAVLREDPDVVLTHLARNVSENLVTVGELHAEHCVRQGLHDHALDLDDAVLLRHVLRIP